MNLLPVSTNHVTSKPIRSIKTGNPNQENIKSQGQTLDLILVNRGGNIYLNSLSSSHLQMIAQELGIEKPEIIDINGKERQYDYLSGYLLKTTKKTLRGVRQSVEFLLRNNPKLIKSLH